MKVNIQSKIDNSESFLLGNDGQYLGKLTFNRFDSESIMNNLGDYGSRFSSISIFNKFSNYGSRFSSLSPFNQLTSTPPFIYYKGQKIGLLTKNRLLGYSNIDPDGLIEWMKSKNISHCG